MSRMSALIPLVLLVRETHNWDTVFSSAAVFIKLILLMLLRFPSISFSAFFISGIRVSTVIPFCYWVTWEL